MRRAHLIIQASEGHQRVVLAGLRALLAGDIGWNRRITRRSIEFDGVGNRHQVLLDRGEEEEPVFLDRPAERPAELILRVSAGIVPEGVGRGQAAVAIVIKPLTVIICCCPTW